MALLSFLLAGLWWGPLARAAAGPDQAPVRPLVRGRELPVQLRTTAQLWPAPARGPEPGETLLCGREGLNGWLLQRLPGHGDTLWRQISFRLPARPHGENESSPTGAYLMIEQQQRLQRDGPLLVHLRWAREWHGAGRFAVITNEDGRLLLALEPRPRLLLSELTTLSNGGYDESDQLQRRGWERDWRLSQGYVRVGPLYHLDGTTRTRWRLAQGLAADCPLTPIKPGRYQYRQGNLQWVGP
ncbi:hypothetical protein EJV47_24125 [Hymenobacter gummosus]|uniref:Uncharacterized protein n=1 Tax=Hymenobacter gummosus TaxID=1776032 RepID=A0A431TWI9_9BACT|nr:hypothetical protein [Hymenobacter gummosus]RTQ45920.1 hypothetical protein EJV47_24125 [Hymenobacter gummosus]